MPVHFAAPVPSASAGNKRKRVDGYAGRAVWGGGCQAVAPAATRSSSERPYSGWYLPHR
jgi:hypothetical protein